MADERGETGFSEALDGARQDVPRRGRVRLAVLRHHVRGPGGQTTGQHAYALGHEPHPQVADRVVERRELDRAVEGVAVVDRRHAGPGRDEVGRALDRHRLGVDEVGGVGRPPRHDAYALAGERPR